MMRKIITLTMFILLVSLISISCFASGSLSKMKNMIKLCEQYVPSESILVIYEKNEDETLITYLNEDLMTYYDFRFDMKAQSSNIIGSTLMVKSESDIKNIVISEYPQAKNLEITTEKTGVNICYKATFTTDKYVCVLKLNPVTGAIGEREFSYLAIPGGLSKTLSTEITEF